MTTMTVRRQWIAAASILLTSNSVVGFTTGIGGHKQAANSRFESYTTTTTTTKATATASFESVSGAMTQYPELCVFDLDACFWDKEMFEMPKIPNENDVVMGDLANGRGRGVVGVYSGSHKISIHKGALLALQNHYDYNYGKEIKFAFASSANTPFAEQIGRASLKLLEVIPGVSVWDLIVGRDWKGKDVNQIGRQPPLLSSNKAETHFPRLKSMTGIRYDRMLFFDDCNWADHCGMVSRGCRESDTGMGPAIVRTPFGLGQNEWEQGLKAYQQQAKTLGKS